MGEIESQREGDRASAKRSVEDLRRLLAEGRTAELGTFAEIHGVLDDETALRLEDAGVGFRDAAGRAWLPGWTRSPRRRTVQRAAWRSLRPESLRAAQLIADHPGERWSERALGLRARTTVVTAHRLLRRLEDEGLVERGGSGRQRARQVTSPIEMRRWLAANGRPSRPLMLTCFVPDPGAIPHETGGLTLALTGAAAAEAMGLPVLTGAPRPIYRVKTGGDEEAFESLPSALGGFRTSRGDNLVLVADPGDLAFLDARTDEAGRRLAPPSRVMLDLLLGPRGESAADVFLDLWGSRAL